MIISTYTEEMQQTRQLQQECGSPITWEPEIGLAINFTCLGREITSKPARAKATRAIIFRKNLCS